MSSSPIEAIAALTAAGASSGLAPTHTVAAQPGTFATILANGVSDLEHKVGEANRLAKAFVLDDSIPVHQVTFAMEEARMSLDLMLQVRARVTEAYQQMMAMQL